VALITVKLPTEEELELQRRFTVNKNYLQAISGFLTTTYGRREKLYAGLRATLQAMPQYQKIQRDPNGSRPPMSAARTRRPDGNRSPDMPSWAATSRRPSPSSCRRRIPRAG
jgi:hypothetical protein